MTSGVSAYMMVMAEPSSNWLLELYPIPDWISKHHHDSDSDTTDYGNEDSTMVWSDQKWNVWALPITSYTQYNNQILTHIDIMELSLNEMYFDDYNIYHFTITDTVTFGRLIVLWLPQTQMDSTF